MGKYGHDREAEMRFDAFLGNDALRDRLSAAAAAVERAMSRRMR